ncbi:MAG: hypothetical protein AAB961_00860, partial [Patescibacteria group bacterium]
MPKELRHFLRTNSSLLVSLVMISIAIAGSIWGLVPFGKTLWSMYKDLNTVRSKTAILSAKYSTLSSLDESQLALDGNDLLRAIPSDKDVATILATIEQTANASGLSVVNLTIANPGSLATEAAQRQSAEEKQLGSGIITSGVTVEGPLANVKTYLNTLQKVRRVLRVQSAEVTIRQGGIGRANITVESFWAALPTTLGDIAAPLPPRSSQEDELLAQIRAFPVSYQGLLTAGPVSFSP